MSFLRIAANVVLLFTLAVCQDRLIRDKRLVVHSNDLNDNDRGTRDTNGVSYDFPIVLPPYPYDLQLSHHDYGTCLLYIDSISVFAFASDSVVTEKRDFTSAAAVISWPKNKFIFSPDSVNCFEKTNGSIGFQIAVDIPEEIVATSEDKSELFSIVGVLNFNLMFELKRDFTWNLQDVELLQDFTLKPKGWLKKAAVVPAKSKSENAKHVYFNGYFNYSYACASSPAVVWKTGADTAIVGLVFNGIQFQPFGIIVPEPTDKRSKSSYRFTTNVNDCEGSFSIGSWMAIIVICLLLAVLSFGYLMLNSVQTMDRFDDPKQKQLIINAKE